MHPRWARPMAPLRRCVVLAAHCWAHERTFATVRPWMLNSSARSPPITRSWSRPRCTCSTRETTSRGGAVAGPRSTAWSTRSMACSYRIQDRRHDKASGGTYGIRDRSWSRQTGVATVGATHPWQPTSRERREKSNLSTPIGVRCPPRATPPMSTCDLIDPATGPPVATKEFGYLGTPACRPCSLWPSSLVTWSRPGTEWPGSSWLRLLVWPICGPEPLACKAFRGIRGRQYEIARVQVIRGCRECSSW